MTLLSEFRKDVVSILSKQVSKKDAESGLEKPPENIGSDLAFPCFLLAKKRKKNPAEIAKEIEAKLKPSGLVGEITFYGPYINFGIDWKKAGSLLVKDILKLGDRFGRAKRNRKRVMVEYSAPNTNKPLHLGHLMNGAIGMSVARILEASGHDVVKANLYNNRGYAVCKTMLAYEKWGKKKLPDIKPDHFVGKFYVMYEKKQSEKLEEEVREMLRKWEKKDSPTLSLWKKMDSWAMKGFSETYRTFGSTFDVEYRESDYWDKAGDIIKKGMKKGIFKKEKDGAILADLEKHDLGKKVVIRSDGTHIYVTNDLALTMKKFKQYNLDRAIWVVASEQNLYFRQLFKMFELLGIRWHKDCCHLGYGMVFLPEGRMKSREGKVVDADDMIRGISELAGKEIRKREKEIPAKELKKRSSQIGLAAIKYFLLKSDTIKDMTFNPDESISFDGDTGPYIQYSHARARSIMRKSGKSAKKADLARLGHEKEIALLKQLADFPMAIERASADLKPHYIAGYALGLATKFNEFYSAVPVLKGREEERLARLKLVEAAAQVIKNSLFLLGIEAPERM